MEKQKSSKIWMAIVMLLTIVCAVQAVVILRYLRVSPDHKGFDTVDEFSSFLHKQFKKEKDDGLHLFDRFFDDDFFSGKKDPFKEMEKLHQQLQNQMDDTLRGRFNHSWDEWFDDRFFGDDGDIQIHQDEKNDAYIITIDIPNLKENKLNVNIDENGIHIDGDFSQSVERKDADGHVVSRHEMHRSLSKNIPLPENADHTKADMETKDNQIIITLPKVE